MSFTGSAIRGGIRGGRRAGSALRSTLRTADDVPTGSGSRAGQAAARSADDSTALRDTARWWGTRGGAAAGIAGAGGLAYRHQDVMQQQAEAEQEAERTEQLDGLPDSLQGELVDNWDQTPEEDGPITQLRDALPGVDSIEQTIVVIVVGAIIGLWLMNQNQNLPNSPIVISGGDT